MVRTAKRKTKPAGKRSVIKSPPARAARAGGQNATAGPRAGSKLATVLALLKRPEGASIEALVKAIGWQAHSVRGAIAGTIRKKLGHEVKSERRDNGERVYSLA